MIFEVHGLYKRTCRCIVKRRKLLQTFVAYTALGAGRLAHGNPLVPTGSDVEGPYYPVQSLPLTSSLLLNEQALGDPLTFSGRMLNTSGAAIPGLRIDVWQCDARQAYNHPADGSQRDPAFRGYAAQISDVDGRFVFDTIVPVSYGGRPPHIHVKIWRNQQELLTTQVYLEGYRGNDHRKIKPVKAAHNDDKYEAQFDFVV